ncbi:N,N-dimethylaniline monooxygenase [Aureococcus anophagefferens]|nr:N,N-dimethylaniline monooxygenase [Aureococcus anophagefferens]
MKQSCVVIGAGPCGLVAAKELREAGHDVVCLEKSQVIGGVFSTLRESSYDDLFLTVSNVFMAYSDFPCEEAYVKYSRKEEYAQYLHRYSAAFGLGDCIKFGHAVTKASYGTGTAKKWRVEATRDDGSVVAFDADALVVSTGSNATPKCIKGVAEGFEGEKLHSSEFQNASDFAGKTCLVIGTGESAADISSELSTTAKHVTCWSRRPFMIAPRFVNWAVNDRHHDEFEAMKTESLWSKAKALDMLEAVTTSRIANMAPLWFYGILRTGLWTDKSHTNPAMIMTGIWGHHYYRSLPADDPNKSKAFWQGDQIGWVTKNSRFAGMVGKGQLDMVVSKTAVFGADSVAFRRRRRRHPQCAELLARYHAMLLSGDKALPDDVAKRTKEEADAETAFYFATPHLTSLVDWPSFSESLAKLIGCTPSAPSFLRPLKFLQWWYLPSWSCWFRQRGPGAKPETLKAVLDRCEPGGGEFGNNDWVVMTVMFFVGLGMSVFNFFSRLLSKPGVFGGYMWNKSRVFVLHGTPIRLFL